MTCRICNQQSRQPTEATHHLERSPIEVDVCLGCWIGWLEMQKFIQRTPGTRSDEEFPENREEVITKKSCVG